MLVHRGLTTIAAASLAGAALAVPGSTAFAATPTPVVVPVALTALADSSLGSTVAPNGDKLPMSLAIVPSTYTGAALSRGDVVVGDLSDAAGIKGRGRSIVRIHAGVTTGFSTSVYGPAGLTFSPGGSQLWAAGYGSTDDGKHGTVTVLRTATSGSSHAGSPYTGGTIGDSRGAWGIVSNGSSSTPLYFWTNADGTLVRDSKLASPYATSTSTKNVHTTLATFAHAASPSLAAGTVAAPQGMVWDAATGTLFVADPVLNQIVAIRTAGTSSGTATVTLIAQGGFLHAPRGLALDRNTDNLLISNGGTDNRLIEMTETGTVVTTRDLDPHGAPGAITGLATTKDAAGQTEIFYLNANTNTVHLLSASSEPVTLTTATHTTARYGQPVTIRGHAPAGATVALFFHRRGVAGFVQRRTLLADTSGVFTTSFVPNDDYSYYAQVGAKTSLTVSQLATPSVVGSTLRLVKHGRTLVLRGHATPHSTVTLHFHKQGTAANNYGLIRLVHTNAAGDWAKSIVVSVAYRVYASRGVDHPYSPRVLILPV